MSALRYAHSLVCYLHIFVSPYANALSMFPKANSFSHPTSSSSSDDKLVYHGALLTTLDLQHLRNSSPEKLSDSVTRRRVVPKTLTPGNSSYSVRKLSTVSINLPTLSSSLASGSNLKGLIHCPWSVSTNLCSDCSELMEDDAFNFTFQMFPPQIVTEEGSPTEEGELNSPCASDATDPITTEERIEKDPYDPRKPEYVAEASEREIDNLKLRLNRMQVQRLQDSVKKRKNLRLTSSEPDLSRFGKIMERYETVISEISEDSVGIEDRLLRGENYESSRGFSSVSLMNFSTLIQFGPL